MRRFAQLYLLYVAGFVPLLVVTFFAEILLYALWGTVIWRPGALGTLGYDDLRWHLISGAGVAAILRVLLNRLAARQPRHYLLLGAGAGVVAMTATQAVIAAAGPLVYSDPSHVPGMLLGIPDMLAGESFLYGLVAVVWVYGDSFSFDGLFRLRSRYDRAIRWLYRPIIPLRGVKKLRWELHLAFFEWKPEDSFDAIALPMRLKALADAMDRGEEVEEELLDELEELDEMETAELHEWGELTTGLRFVRHELLRIEGVQKKPRSIDATVGREILASLDRCEEILAGQKLDASMARDRYKVKRFMRTSRAMAEMVVKIGDAEGRGH